jgi:hypothetical protein
VFGDGDGEGVRDVRDVSRDVVRDVRDVRSNLSKGLETL